MSATDIVLAFIAAFQRLDIPYMLVGSYSSNVYGRPRSTHDADFVVQASSESIARLRAEFGPPYVFDPQMSFEGITGTMRHIVDHPATPFRVELFELSDDPHDLERFERRQQKDFEGMPVWFPTPEDVIVTKLRWSKQGRRAKDVEDVKNVLSVRSRDLELAYIRRWCGQHGTRELFESLLASNAT